MDDSEFYERVAAELGKNDVKPGVWAKAIAESLGDTDVAKGLYIRFRVEQLIREAQAREAQSENEAKARAKAAAKRQRENWVTWALLLAFVGFAVLSFLLGNLGDGNRIEMPPTAGPVP